MTAPWMEYVPAEHTLHLLDPFSVAYVPAKHVEHLVDPLCAEYDPPRHCVQLLILTAFGCILYVPATHSIQTLDFCGDHLPGGQIEQLTEPLFE